MIGWISSSPEATRALRAADRAFDKAMSAAAGLKLADKIVAIRAAKTTREAAYSAVMKGNAA